MGRMPNQQSPKIESTSMIENNQIDLIGRENQISSGLKYNMACEYFHLFSISSYLYHFLWYESSDFRIESYPL